MRCFLLLLVLLLLSSCLLASELPDSLRARFLKMHPGAFGMNVPGVKTHFATTEKVVVLTFDACGGPHGDGYNRGLIEFLRANRIPATLFFTGRWAESHPVIADSLAVDSLFEIENHGQHHKPLAFRPEKAYGIESTASVEEAAHEILDAGDTLRRLTQVQPQFYRSGTAWYQEAAVQLAEALGYVVVNGDILPQDGDPHRTPEQVADTLLAEIHPGAIIMMHMNHPERSTLPALELAIPQLQAEGWHFVRLRDIDDLLQ